VLCALEELIHAFAEGRLTLVSSPTAQVSSRDAKGFGLSEIDREPCLRHSFARSRRNRPNVTFLIEGITETSPQHDHYVMTSRSAPDILIVR
jgi:hypothetical protein